MRERYLELMAGLVRARIALGKGPHQDLFSFVVDAKDPGTGKGFSENELWAESRFLLIAALFFYLFRNKACYGKLVAEIRKTFDSVSEIQTGPRLAQWHYLRACTDESMRMSPPISSTLWRTISAADGVWIDGNYISKGVDIGVSPYASHHIGEIFPDSYKLKPDRWIESPENSSEAVEKARAAVGPFSIGTRACAGRTMAYTEISNTITRTL
ncbi:cytochrome P450 3A31 [Botrytis cinerea]